MARRTDNEIIATTHNLARFFVENQAISWVLLIGVIAWGIFGYTRMPKRKDPDIPVREAVAICPWPGVRAEKIEADGDAEDRKPRSQRIHSSILPAPAPTTASGR